MFIVGSCTLLPDDDDDDDDKITVNLFLYDKGNVLTLSEKVIAFFKEINLFILFIYFWLHWVFAAARRLSLVAASGGYSLMRFAGFSLRWLLLLWSTGSRCVSFSRCGMRAQ